MPNEILTKIFSYLPQNCLHKVALVSRRFHAVVEPLLYRRVVLANYRGGGRPRPLQIFLRTILSRPVLASRVQSLDLTWQDILFGHPDPNSSPQDAIDFDLFEAARQSLDLPYLHSRGSQDGQVALLLQLVPNLRIFEFITPMVTVHDPVLSLPTGLQHLREVRVNFAGRAASPWVFLAILKQPFIRVVHVATLRYNEQHNPPLSAYPAKSSSVTRLSFGYGTIRTLTLTHILAMPRALTHFSYVEQNGYEGCFGASLFGVGLKCCRDTLQQLTLRFICAYRIFSTLEEVYNRRATIGSMRDWPVLRSISCPLAVLLGKGQWDGMLRLVDVLPVVITDLRIDDDDFWSDSEVAEQVVELVEQKATYGYYQLAKITIWHDVAEIIRPACDAGGVALVGMVKFGPGGDSEDCE